MKTFEFESHGYTTIEVLDLLVGRPWDERAQSFLRSLRPSSVRVHPMDELKSDARPWRVTVMLDGEGLVRRVEQEVEVGLARGWAAGKDAQEWLEKGPKWLGHDGGPADEARRQETCTGQLVHDEFTRCPVHDR